MMKTVNCYWPSVDLYSVWVKCHEYKKIKPPVLCHDHSEKYMYYRTHHFWVDECVANALQYNAVVRCTVTRL